jgi:hypothetical protein
MSLNVKGRVCVINEKLAAYPKLTLFNPLLAQAITAFGALIYSPIASKAGFFV